MRRRIFQVIEKATENDKATAGYMNEISSPTRTQEKQEGKKE